MELIKTKTGYIVWDGANTKVYPIKNDKVRICSNAELKVKGKILIVPIGQVPIDQALIDQEDLTLLVEEENHLILLPLIGNISYAIVVLPEPKEKT